MTDMLPQVTFKWQDIPSIVADESLSTEAKDQVLDVCVAQLCRDKLAYESGTLDSITDCAVWMPRPGSRLDKTYNTGHILAKKLFKQTHPLQAAADDTDIDDTTEDKTGNLYKWRLMSYKQLIAKLSQVCHERKKKLDAINLRPKKAHRTMCLMRNLSAPVSDYVLDPVPMPVTEAPLNELEPALTALGDSSPPEFSTSETEQSEIMAEYKRGVIFPDGRLDLCKQVVGPQHIHKVMDALKDNTFISHFLLGNNITGIKGAEAVSSFIANEHKPVIETWYLAGNEIDSEGMKLLAKSLETDTDTKSLWLKRNPLREQGAQAIGQMLQVNTTLKVLDLSNTGILEEGVKSLFSALHDTHGPRSNLRSLYLDANGLTPACSPAIASYFAHLATTNKKGLTRLWIGMNRLCDEGAIPILEALGKYPFIRTLSLNSNRLGWKSAEAAYLAFRAHRKIRVLDFGMYKATVDMGEAPNSIGDEGARFLTQLLEENSSLQKLDICENNISDEGVRKLVAALTSNESLLLLNFSQNGKRYEKTIGAENNRLLERNRAARIQGAEEMGKNEMKLHLRRIIHGKRVDHIDSIYRTRAKSGQSS